MKVISKVLLHFQDGNARQVSKLQTSLFDVNSLCFMFAQTTTSIVRVGISGNSSGKGLLRIDNYLVLLGPILICFWNEWNFVFCFFCYQ